MTQAPIRKTPVLAIILVSYLMIVLDISITLTALPSIRDDLGFSPANLSWVQTAYILGFGGLLMLGARAGDVLGRRRMFVAGIALFTVASLLVGAAQSSCWMIAARALQGIGAAVLATSTLSMLQTSFDEGPERTRAAAYYGAVAGIGASLGLVLGGVITDALSSRVAFVINVPIGLAMVAAAPVAVRVPKLTTRYGNGLLLAGGMATTTIGMYWLRRLSGETSYLTGLALR